MNKQRTGAHPRRKRIVVFTLLLGYLFGILAGCFVIWLIPVTKNRADLLEIAHDKGQEVLSAGLMDEVMIFGMEHYFYTSDGFVISHESAFLHNSQRDYIGSFVPRTLEEGELFLPTFFLLDNRAEDPRRIFGMVAAVSVTGPGGHQFVSVLLRDLPDLDTTMISYVAIFTILYLVGVLFTVITVKKERELNRMRRDLIANVSHELKTPITSIRAMTEVLHDGMLKDPEAKHRFSAKIIEETDRLERLVLDILELSKLQSNRAEFKKTAIYADGLIPPVMDRYMMLCGDLGIHLDTSGLNLQPVPPLHTDANKIISLIETLMDNAVKFTGAGGTIWVSSQIHSKHVTFCIRDNGPGIRAEDVPRVFERFYKADVAHNSSGSGLGLAIAEEIARGLGEKIWLESEFGKGTSFYFTISYSPRRNQSE